MAVLDEKQDAGVAFIGDMLGEGYSAAFRKAATSDGFGAAVIRNAASACFHDAWLHPGIGRKEKSIAVITALIAQRQPLELKNHVKIGLANGLTVAQLEGILVQLAPYLGFPCLAMASTAFTEALREAGVPADDLVTIGDEGST